MEKKDISMQLYTTRHFQPYDPILKFLSNSGITNIELFSKTKNIWSESFRPSNTNKDLVGSGFDTSN